jgi:hypothetical protein
MAITHTYIDDVLTIKGHNGETLHWSNPAALLAALEYTPPSEAEIDPATGTSLGNMTSGGGLTAVLTGSQSKNFVPGGWYGAAASNAYAGLAFAAAKTVSRALVYGFADHGFAYTQNANVTLTLYGKNGAPSGATEALKAASGTVLGSVGPFTDANGLEKEIVVTSPQAFTHYWVTITYSGTVVNGAALIRMFELL